MTEAQPASESLFPVRVGERLKAARTKAGLDLSDLATRTRVPLRHLNALESGDYSEMPSVTYSVGFARSYARAVGEDEVEIAAMMRNELGQSTPSERAQAMAFDDDDFQGPVASKRLAWTAFALFVLVAAGYGLWRSYWVPDTSVSAPREPAAENSAETSAAPAAAPAPVNPSGQVVLTAKETVWVRVYDAADKVLLEKELAKGESWQVPADANGPMIRTGGAERIAVMIDGKEVAPLGPAERTVKDVGISAQALTARAAPLAATPAPVAGNTTATAAPARP
jgi:cytoskeleton protein RodZ